MSHLALTEIYPEECTQHGYRVVGLAQRRALDKLRDGEPLGTLRARARELLSDPGTLEQLQQAAAAMPIAEDPWIWAIERQRRNQEYASTHLLAKS